MAAEDDALHVDENGRHFFLHVARLVVVMVLARLVRRLFDGDAALLRHSAAAALISESLVPLPLNSCQRLTASLSGASCPLIA